MITVRIKKKGKKLNSIKTAVKKIDSQRVEVGFFQSQGRHIDGMYSYVALAQALERGYFPVQQINRVPLPFMDHILNITMRGMLGSATVTRGFRKWSRNLDKKASPSHWMNAVGKYAVEQSGNVFGNRMYFPQAPPWNKNPVYETGDLARHFTYRTSFDKQVRRR